ncbi:MAG: nucleotidyltransferase domain-containing protein [Parcubacteria group bacterium]
MSEEEIREKIEEITDKIIREYQPKKIILFGSYAWGTPSKDSDMDLFIVKETKKNIFERNREVGKIVFGSRIAIDALVYTPEQLKRREEIGDPFVRKIIGNGKVVYEQ